MNGWRILLLCSTFFILGYAGKLEVTADKFTHVDSKKQAVFEGHAHAQEGKSKIDADKFIIYLDKDNEAKEYHAIKNVRFEIIRPSQHIKGRCNYMVYNVKDDSYKLKGNAKLEDILNKRKMSGSVIYLDNKKQNASVTSTKNKPVKFIFQMKDKKKRSGKK